MKRRLVILTEIISPYRIPLFNALSRHTGVDQHVIFLAETDPRLRQWRVYKDEIRFSYEVLPSRRMSVAGQSVLLNHGVGRALTSAAPDVILCGGYNYVASWQALAWARRRAVPFLLWSESHVHENRKVRPLVEFLKDEFLRRCDGFVVPGVMAREYLHAHKVKDDVIFTAPNAVDNELFATAANQARGKAVALRAELGLPERYFLFAGRLVRAKGVFELLAAYAKLKEVTRQKVGMVFVGDGIVRAELAAQAASISPGVVRFAGFAHREQLAAYYALAEMLVLPTYSDTWGLVVNEAMACGLPVILSAAAGCAADLVTENWNGLIVPSYDASALAAAMGKLAGEKDLRSMMASNSSQRVSRYSPEEWALGIAGAIAASGEFRD